MSLLRLSLVVLLLIGGTTVAVISYVESRRPVQVPVAVDHQERSKLEPPGRLTPQAALEESGESASA